VRRRSESGIDCRRFVSRLALLAVLLLVPEPAFAAGRDEAQRARADALLAEKSGWDEAIAIYRALVAADDAWIEPRLQLARVLAWRGDYDDALAHFDRLAATESPPPGLAVERAEVLSWAGRTRDAALAFESIVETEPENARAARGLARVYRWSGERSRSDRWYVRALDLEDDAEARREHDAMRAELGTAMTGGVRGFYDSEDFRYWRTESRIARDLDFDTRLYASSATHFVSHHRQPGAVLYGDPDETRGFDARLGVERRLGPRWKLFGDVGARYWEDADSLPLARGGFEWMPVENTSIGFEMSYDDLLERSYSLESVLENVRRGGAKLSAWRQLTPSIEGYAETGGGLISGSNGDVYGGASVSWKPFERHDVRVALALDASRYAEYSPYYYSPELDLGTLVSLAGKLPLRGPLAFTFDVGGGGGLSQEQGVTETGPAYRVKAGFAWRRGRFALDVDAARTQSVRAIAYTTHEFALRTSWSF
jgi:tetratricopeptide (TPR) repeat protein